VPQHDQTTALGRRLQIAAGIVAVALLIGFVVANRTRSAAEAELADAARDAAEAPVPVVTVQAADAPATETLTLPGETAACYESTIYARISGYVGTWTADIGDHVRKGDVLATIETPDLDAEFTAAQAKLKAADAEVRVRQAQAAFARTTYERWRNSPKGVVSDQEREAKKADYDSAVAQQNAAMAQVNVDQGEVDRLTALLAFKQVTAPYDGTNTERRIDIGNLVTAGSTAATTPLYRLSHDDPMRVFVDVPQSAAGDIATGLSATVTMGALPNRSFTGTVTRTARAIDSKARTLRVEVDIPNKDSALVPGMYVQVAMSLKMRGAVEVPAAALIFRSDGPHVAVVGSDGRVHFRPVTIARDNGNRLDLGSGIEPGARIVLNIGSDIADGDKVVATGQPGLASASSH